MENYNLCMELVDADSEKQVDQILNKAGYLKNNHCWKDYGNLANNLSMIDNQQARADGALVENLVNAADAVLIGRCKRDGHSPDDPGKAPGSIRDALNRYFDIDEADRLAGMTATARGNLAKDTSGLMACGEKARPSYVVFDQGEGQHPHDFESTFLSLAGTNKLNVPFVQGKFNQGSTGVLRFSKYKLILSKKDPAIDGESVKWGFTLIKKFPPQGNAKSSVYKYLFVDGGVPQFEAEELDILPGDYPSKMGKPMSFGTFIKLYEYDIGPGLKTNIQFDLNYRLSSLLVEPMLPIRLYERRDFKGHTFETTLNGLAIRLEEDRDKNLEPGFPIGETFQTSVGNFNCKIYALKEKADHNKFSGKDGVVFSINGQSHGALSRDFFKRKKVAKEWLAKSLIVIIDCTSLSSQSVETVFMPSRDRLVSGKATNEIKSKIEDIIHDSQKLKQLQNTRRQERIEASISDNKLAAEIFQRVIKNSSVLSKLLISGERITDPFKGEGKGQGKQAFKGLKHPTYFTLMKEMPEEEPKRADRGHAVKVKFQTDVEDSYLIRQISQGNFSLSSDDLAYRLGHNDGIWTLNLDIPKGAPLGEKVSLTAEISDPTLAEPLSQTFFIEFNDPQPNNGGGKSGKRKTNIDNTKGNKEGSGHSGLAMPNILEVRKDKWTDHDFDRYSALRVVGSDDGSDYFVNMDNLYLLAEKKSSKIDQAVLENRFKLAHVFFAVSMLAEHSNSSNGESNEVFGPDEDIHGFIRKMSRSLAPVILPLIEQLGSADSMNEPL
tara:strand:- start:234 stop:2564 length:2331 start_codon:yes stop_codon:yes gene_type:complete